ncbi:hypothetical protein [Nocardioides piscis]|uniref:DUF222 domain-containing protein n=1 Tax=Nocardioides piscis TaxID=2714938 RepID=A0A6G7YHZ0_9ACTN|nr:hypothetical protein [Nocardioides piscis]QIK76349.1 hypothetical protein G7071_13905 [Nocardioides piscis]
MAYADAPDPQDAAGAVLPPTRPGDGVQDVVELSDRELLEAVASGVTGRRLAEVSELELVVQWAVRQGHPRDERDPMTTPGGDGTPSVREYALPELAMARSEHTLRTRSLVGDGLDLVHRLPLTWTKVRAGQAEPWVARRVAVLSRRVPAAQVGLVDRAVARVIAGHAPSTVLETAAAKVIEADPEAHAMERERERHRRHVTLSKADELGFRHVIARVTAGDAIWVDAMVERMADILSPAHGHDHNRDELRSLAFGWLARPVDLLKLLVDHTPSADAAAPDELGPDERPVWAPDHLVETVGRLCDLSTRQLASLRGRGVVFVHVTAADLLKQSGLARVEGQGPMLLQSLSELLGHADVQLKPVIDHRLRARADAYEHPDPVKDHVWTQTGGDVFPFSPRTATRAGVDFDHSSAFVPPASGGPPGQTGPHNSGPLRRSHHRWKTHGGYRCRQAGPGRHVWQTPHGLCYLVDAEGTRRLSDSEAHLILTAPPGVDVYPA